MKNKNFMCHVPYPRNSITYDHDLVTIVYNDDIAMRYFQFFKNVNFSDC